MSRPRFAPRQAGPGPLPLKTAPPPKGRTARAWAEIDLDALRYNAKVLQAFLPAGCLLMPVLKANAYGHGLALTGRALSRAGVRAFAVATLEEGVALRKAGVRGEILILGYTPAACAFRLWFWQLSQTVADAAHARALSAAGLPLKVHIALDTGMHRLGLPAVTPQEQAALQEIFLLPGLKICGVYSHLCTVEGSSCAEKAFVKNQTDAFFAAVNRLRAAGLDPGRVHLQASYGILQLPPLPCGYARAGVALFGAVRKDVRTPLPLRPVLSLRARVACVRRVAAGDSAGYGLDFTARRETLLATVSIGFVDGVPRAMPEHGASLLLHGRRAPVVGRVCMDQLLLDVTGIPNVQPGDAATLIGRDGGEEITALELARCGSTVPELLGRLGARLPRIPAEGKPAQAGN